MKPRIPKTRSGKKVAVIGGGPAGLAAASFLSRAGVDVTVFEKNDKMGGVPRYVIPGFRISDDAIDKDVALCSAYGAKMVTGREIKSVKELRDEGFFVEYDLVGRGIKPQMKYADKIGSKFVLVLGDNELETGEAKLKNMASGEQIAVKLDNSFTDTFSNALMAEMFKDLDEELAELGRK
jgi:histidyl-tRNA synthetase